MTLLGGSNVEEFCGTGEGTESYTVFVDGVPALIAESP